MSPGRHALGRGVNQENWGDRLRGNRGFLLTREAPAHGRSQTMPKGFFKHGFQENGYNTETATMKQAHGIPP